jgi:hypothetical protein
MINIVKTGCIYSFWLKGLVKQGYKLSNNMDFQGWGVEFNRTVQCFGQRRWKRQKPIATVASVVIII